jgi:hypothetical protein
VIKFVTTSGYSNRTVSEIAGYDTHVSALEVTIYPRNMRPKWLAKPSVSTKATHGELIARIELGYTSSGPL